MSPTIYPGYMGYAKIGETIIRCTGMSVNPIQEPLFYDHVIGLKDKYVTDSGATKGEYEGDEEDLINSQKVIYRPSVIRYEGTIDFPVADISECNDDPNVNMATVFELVKLGKYFDVELYYNCLIGRKYSNCRINSFNFSVTAGDIASVSISISATDLDEIEWEESFETPQKLVTWDAVDLVLTESGGETTTTTTSAGGDNRISELQGFSMEINNNLNTIHTNNSLKPKELRVGMQHVTGTLTQYNKHGSLFMPTGEVDSKMSLTIGNFSTDINCIFHPSTIDGVTTSLLSVTPFTGIDFAFGDPTQEEGGGADAEG